MLNQPAEKDRVNVPEVAFIRKSGQLWKLVVAGMILPIPGVAIGFLAIRSLASGGSEAYILAAAGLLLLIDLVITGLLVSARCPDCRSRFVIWVLRSREGTGAVTGLLHRPDCPCCGSLGASTRGR